jgi:hypothetical protein
MISVLKANNSAMTTVRRSRFFSITVDPAADAPGVDEDEEDQPDAQAELQDPQEDLDDVHGLSG